MSPRAAGFDLERADAPPSRPLLQPFKEVAKKCLRRSARTRWVRRVVTEAIRENPEIALEPLFSHFNDSTFEPGKCPERLRGFEDLAFLFTSNQLNAGIAILAFDEAAYLYGLIRGLGKATLVEIGRFKGGSTFLMAAAMDEGAELYSYDWFSAPLTPLRKSNGVARYPARGSADRDRRLQSALDRYGLGDRVHVLVADSHTAQPPPAPCDLIFIDGDHSYAGVAADFDHWGSALRPGGHLLFHDAYARELAPAAVGVQQLVADIVARHSGRFCKRDVVGSIAHFVRRQED